MDPVKDEDRLQGMKVALLVDNGFEQVELVQPRLALDTSGADTDIVSPQHDRVRGGDHTKWGDEFDVDTPLSDAKPDEYDALVLPGGVMNPDKLRMKPEAVAFVKAFFDAGKPAAAICHGPWTIINAGAARGRTLTSWPSLQADLCNAGAEWRDQEVVVDRNLVSSRNPNDIPAFNREMIALFARSHSGARQSA